MKDGFHLGKTESATTIANDKLKSTHMPELRKAIGLFPFARRARVPIFGLEQILRKRSQLHFVHVATDLAPRTRAEVLRRLAPYPIVECFSSSEISEHFGKPVKVLGFAKSSLAKNIYAHLKDSRLNPPSGEQ
jgi:ribosomal protein L7Ae-like RNA K-turn-binding protein